MPSSKTIGQNPETIDANVGIIGHEAFAENTLSMYLNQKFSNVFIWRDSLKKDAAPHNPTRIEIDKFIKSMSLDLVVLEANLGTAGGDLAFDPNFFNDYPDVYFCLYSGRDLNVEVQALPDNVLGYLTKPTTVDQIKKVAADYVDHLPPEPLVNKAGTVQARTNPGDNGPINIGETEDDGEGPFDGEGGGG